MRHNAYLQAVHETGARLTHDMKNLLQSLYALISLAPRETADPYGGLLQRQLPQLTQRLHATLEKLRAPEAATSELPVPAGEWWAGTARRLSESGIALSSTIDTARNVPAPLLDSFVENGVENARVKAAREAGVAISVAFRAVGDDVVLEVRDTGSAIAADLAQRLFREPIERGEGLGIGLYHLGRQALAAGYRAELAENRDGDIRFRLSVDR